VRSALPEAAIVSLIVAARDVDPPIPLIPAPESVTRPASGTLTWIVAVPFLGFKETLTIEKALLGRAWVVAPGFPLDPAGPVVPPGAVELGEPPGAAPLSVTLALPAT
jgi:hypothetical protein